MAGSRYLLNGRGRGRGLVGFLVKQRPSDANPTVYTNWFFDQLATASGQIKVWLGSWVAKPVKFWNGSAWVAKPIKHWNGTTWILSNE